MRIVLVRSHTKLDCAFVHLHPREGVRVLVQETQGGEPHLPALGEEEDLLPARIRDEKDVVVKTVMQKGERISKHRSCN